MRKDIRQFFIDLLLFRVVKTNGRPQQFGRAVDVDLFLYPCAIGLDSFDVDSERLADLPCAAILAQQLEHLHLAIAWTRL